MKNYNNITKEEIIAEDSSSSRVQKMRKIALNLKHHGSTKDCQRISADNGKVNFYVKPNQDINERLEHYRDRWSDAKIVK